MTQDIIEMAREAGFYNHTPMYFDDEMLVAFAHLVAAKEREACAKVCDEVGEHPSLTPQHCAESIRARGEQALAQPEQDGDCKKCKDGCPACDARKLQKEAHDLL
jgi:hypothetical protein